MKKRSKNYSTRRKNKKNPIKEETLIQTRIGMKKRSKNYSTRRKNKKNPIKEETLIQTRIGMKKRSKNYSTRKNKKNPIKEMSLVDDGVDRISELPDDVLVTILSFLKFREATATKILSSRWGHLDSTPIVVTISFPFPLEEKETNDRGIFIQSAHDSKISEYISRTNDALDSYEGRQSIDKFKIDIPCVDGDHSEKWLVFALSKETEHIDIRMIYRKSTIRPPNFSSFDKILIRDSFKYLKELSLSRVYLRNYGNLPRNCFALERLSIDTPPTTDICIHFEGIHHGSVCQLKYLNISNFAESCYISISDMMKLVSLRCHGLELHHLTLLGVPKLVDISIVSAKPDRYDGILPYMGMMRWDIFSRLVRFQLHVRHLDHGTGYICKNIPCFTKLKHMELDIELNQQCNHQHLFPLIQKCPSMKELHIKFLWSSKVTYESRKLNKKLIGREAVVNKLQTVKLSGYLGTVSEFEFVLYVVKNTTNLKDLIMVEDGHKNHAVIPPQMLITRASEHLRSVIPSSVNFHSQ